MSSKLVPYLQNRFLFLLASFPELVAVNALLIKKTECVGFRLMFVSLSI